MNCPNCGFGNADDATFCTSCGQSLAAAPAAAPAPPAPPAAYAPPAPPAPPAPLAAPAPPAAPAGYAPPQQQYAPQGYAQPQVVATTQIKNHLVMAILATLFCCWPFGLAGIIFATQVNKKLAMGDVMGAQKASKNAALWSWLAIGGGLLAIIAYVILMALGIASGEMSSMSSY